MRKKVNPRLKDDFKIRPAVENFCCNVRVYVKLNLDQTTLQTRKKS